MPVKRPGQIAPREKLAAIVESSDDAIVGKTLEGIITSWNQGAERIYGYRAEEVVGLPISITVPPERQNEVSEILRRIRMGQRVHHFETVRITKDGRRIQVSLSVSPIRSPEGDIVGAAAISRDISERVRADQERAQMLALAESEERFRSVAERAADAIISANEKGVITYFNRSAERMFGLSAIEVTGKPLTELMPSHFHAAHTAGLERYKTTGEARVIGRVVELEGRRKDGSVFPLELSIATWKVAGANLYTGILRDITERKQTEAQLAGRTQELAAAYAEMEAFAYTISHDLRAPLRALEGYSRVLLQDYSERLDDRGKKSLRRIAVSAQKMDKMLVDLLEYSRVGRGKLNMVDTELRSVLEQVLATLASVIDERKARVITMMPMPSVQADVDLLVRMLTNLLQNALKFVEAGRQPEIEISAQAQGKEVRVWVKDNGIGIAPEDQGRVWGVFERLHAGEAYAGTGIGLAIVKRGAERMGGRAGLESGPGAGSRFWVELPAARGQAG